MLILNSLETFRCRVTQKYFKSKMDNPFTTIITIKNEKKVTKILTPVTRRSPVTEIGIWA